MRSLAAIFVILVLAAQGVSQPENWTAGVVDSLYDSMTIEERVGQVFMIRAHSNLGEDHVAFVKRQIKDYHVGGMCFFQGTPQGHAELINEYQSMSQTPLLMAIDAEWGGGMRFKETGMSFPRQLTLGAIQDNALLYEMGVEVGRQLKEIGLHVNFAPVADINNNPLNPVISDRSFGEGKFNVTAKSYQYMRGMQDAGILACAKHFPGHGDTDVDSHYDLPVIPHSRERLDSLELYPFEVLIQKGVESVMVAHLSVPALDDTPNLPTTLSPKVVTGLLREKMGFDGLIFTDALEMKGVTKHYGAGEVEIKALQAGNDVLCLPENIDEAFPAVLAAVNSGKIDASLFERAVKRILSAKITLDLLDYRPVGESPDMFPARGLAIKEELIENALTAAANDDSVLPIRDTRGKSVACLVIGANNGSVFKDRLKSYTDIKAVNIASNDIASRGAGLLNLLGENDIVIVALTGMDKSARKNFGLDPGLPAFLKALNERTKVVLTVFGSPYSLKFFEELPTILMSYQDDAMVQDITAQAIFGAISVKGRLPVTASVNFPVSHGVMIPSIGRLGYSSPERMNMSSDTLEKIALVVEDMVRQKAAPGCQILVAKEGKVVYKQAFGHFTYDRRRPVSNNDLYDVASVTKVVATTMAVMKLYESRDLLPKQTLHFYLDEVGTTNKEHLIIEDIMAHQAGLQPWIPFYRETLERRGGSEIPSPSLYKEHKQDSFGVHVARNMFMKDMQRDSIWQRILDSKLRANRRYRYSDIGFYMLAEIIERQAECGLDTYCVREFYSPLGMYRTGYNPLERFDRLDIAPTEVDHAFRKQTLQGFVHDAGSAMLGGVGGHAGIFSNSSDLAIIMQMLLNQGTYADVRYFEPSTVSQFTTRVPNSKRRALGFDMKNLEEDVDLQMSELASEMTFGHTGFTGTCVWADPASGLVFIFLSNRTYPNSRNNKLNKLEIRERIHTIVYQSLNT